jgi:hypothetical protein
LFVGGRLESGILDVADLDLLSAAIRTGTTDLKFDVNKDRFVTTTDRRIWVTELKETYFGDSKLEGEFNTTDLVSVFQGGEYEDEIIENSTWATGDWDGNGEFDRRDLILAFTENGYEQGPRPASSQVPEPTGLVLASAWFLWATKRGRRQYYSVRNVSGSFESCDGYVPSVDTCYPQAEQHANDGGAGSPRRG